jgi:hypothetical protein
VFPKRAHSSAEISFAIKSGILYRIVFYRRRRRWKLPFSHLSSTSRIVGSSLIYSNTNLANLRKIHIQTSTVGPISAFHAAFCCV